MTSLWPILHAALWMGAVALAASRYTLGSGMAGAALGALGGVFAARALAFSRLRTRVIPLLGLGAALAALFLASLLSRWPWPAGIVGPGALYAAADFIPAVIVPLSLVGTLEALARRHSAWRLAGLGILAGLYATLFAAHREGFLNRPYFLVDPLWGSGLDPLPWFLFLGLVLVALLAVMMVGHNAGRRALAGLGILLAGLVAAFLMLPQRHLKEITELHRVMGDGKGKEPSSSKGGSGKPDPGGQPLPDTFEDQTRDAGNSPLAVVVFHNDYTPPMGLYYFRELAFSTYNGARLVQDASNTFDRDLPGFGAAVPGLPGKAVRTTVAVMAAHARPMGLVSAARIQETGNPDPKRFFQAYDVESRVSTTHPRYLVDAPAGDPRWNDAALAHFTQGPADPRYGELVGRIVEELPKELRDKPFARALAIKIWMDRSTTYSLNTTHGDSPDPLGDFLFGDKRGHCVYLAHAACLLYRAAGVPSRVAAGYAVEPSFRFEGASLLLRGSNAHAWPEVNIRGQGWIPLDISPARSEAPPQEAPDKGLQQMLGEMAMSEKPPPIPPPEAGKPPLHQRLEFLARLLGALLLALAALALPAAFAITLWRRFIPYASSPSNVPRLAYRAALDAASAHGHRRAFGENREALAARLAQVSPAFAELTALHLRWALGSRQGAPPATLSLALLKASRAQFRAASGPWRRWLAPLNPLAWIRVH